MSGVYISDSSAETKVREALIAQLSNITTGNGFRNTLATPLRDFPSDPDGLSSFPTVAVLTGYDHRDHFDNNLLYIAMKVPLVVFVDPGGTVPDEIESVKQDIHYVIGNNPGLPDGDGNATCQLAIFSTAAPFGTVLANPLAGNAVGVKIVVDVLYQQTLSDPTVS